MANFIILAALIGGAAGSAGYLLQRKLLRWSCRPSTPEIGRLEATLSIIHATRRL